MMIFDVLILFLAFLYLSACLWFGHQRFIRQYQSLKLPARLAMLLMTLTLVGGFTGAFGWWFALTGSFAWELPSLASRFLAVAGWCFALISWYALAQPTKRRLKVYSALLTIYMLPLVLAILLFHMDRFDWASPITYPFFFLVLLITAAGVYLLLNPPTMLPDSQADLATASRPVRYWLQAVALIFGLWGLGLFVTETGLASQPWANLIWAWPADLLTSRLIAVMLLTISVSAWLTHKYADGARLSLQLGVIYGLGVSIASLWNGLAGKPIPYGYLFMMGGLFFISTLLLLSTRRTN